MKNELAVSKLNFFATSRNTCWAVRLRGKKMGRDLSVLMNLKEFIWVMKRRLIRLITPFFVAFWKNGLHPIASNIKTG